MYQIEISNQQSIIELDESLIRQVMESLFIEEQLAQAKLSLAFIDNKTIRQINRDYLSHDYATDVISFLLESHTSNQQPEPADVQQNRSRGKRIEGEVLVSTEMARTMAAEYEWSAADEMLLYTVHGTLHLLGYDDLTETEQKIMRTREQQVLARWNLTPRYVSNRESKTKQITTTPSDNNLSTGVAGAGSA